MRKIILCSLLMIICMLSICFGFSDNGFDRKPQFASPKPGGQKIIVIQTLDVGEYSKAFVCYLTYGDKGVMEQHNFGWRFERMNFSLGPKPWVTELYFGLDDIKATKKITKTLTIDTTDNQPIYATCYYVEGQIGISNVTVRR